MPSPSLHVVILAAGKGSRMYSELPKVLHKVANKSLLEHVIDAALGVSPNRIHIVVGHGKEQVIEALAPHPYSKNFNWITQSKQLGTGHAVMQALPSIDSNSNVLILTADVPLLQSSSLASLIDMMETSPLAILTAIMEDPFGLGRIVRDDTDKVIGIVEEKDACEEEREIQEINSGIMCAHVTQLGNWLSKIKNNNVQQEYYLTDIANLAFQTGNPISTLQVAHNDEVSGINNRAQLALAERAYQRRQVERFMSQGVTIIDPARVDIRGDVNIGADTILDINTVLEGPMSIGSNVYIGPNCVISASTIADNVTIHPHTVIENAELASGTNVGPFARLRPGTKLGANVKIGNFVETKNAQLAAGAKVNHLSYVGDATVGSNTNIGAGVITCNYDGAHKHQTKIGENVFVGSDSQLIAPINIADGATIGAGSTITNNVDENQLAISRTKQKQINGWQRPTKNKPTPNNPTGKK